MKKTILILGVTIGVTITLWERYLNYLALDIALLALLLVLFVLTIIAIKFNQYYFKKIAKGAPYVPTDDETIQNMLALAQIKPGQKVVDLGSGDGRILLHVAKEGAEAHGYEISPILVWLTKYKIWKSGYRNKAFVYKKSFWKEDLSNFDVVILFGIPYIMDELTEKFKSELPSHAKIISNKFEIPNLKKLKKMGRASLYTFK